MAYRTFLFPVSLATVALFSGLTKETAENFAYSDRCS